MTIVIRPMQAADLVQVSDLHARVFGPGRFARTAYRLREGQNDHAGPYCQIAMADETCVGSVTVSEVFADAGNVPGVLIGPVAVDSGYVGQGIGARMITRALDAVRAKGHASFAVLVGDLSFYGRFGFKGIAPGTLLLPGPVDASRVLVLPFADTQVSGMLRA